MKQINTKWIVEWIVDEIKKSLVLNYSEQVSIFPSGKSFWDYLSVPHTAPKGSLDVFKKQMRSEFDSIKKEFQNKLADNLKGKTEHQLFSDRKDSADIWVDKDDYEVIIEIDAARADQVGKKMLSRYCYSARLSPKPIVYIALLYQGTASMNESECEKYFQMGYEVLKRINPSNIFIGYIINDRGDKCYLPNEYKAFDKQLYSSYLSNMTPGSVNSYMLPLNKVHLFVSPKEIQKKLSQYDGKSNIEDYLYRLKILQKREKLDKNRKTYWRTYCEYLTKNAKQLGL